MEVQLAEMMEAREMRAMRQMQLLRQYQKPLISFSMNIAGPVKDNAYIRRGYAIGKNRLDMLLMVEKIPVLHFEERMANTGCENLYVLDAPADRIKALTTQIEESDALGRLFDMDVINPDGSKQERPTPRKCLICGERAQICARSRTHTVAELQKKTQEILESAIAEEDAERAAELAVRALLYEVGVTPKPGLVDRSNSGSHADMDFFTFQSSAAALYPYFQECLLLTRKNPDEPAVGALAKLRFPGKLAEGKMRFATGNVNTHKGAIFSMGILCGALGRLSRTEWKDPDRVLGEVAAMCANLLETDREILSDQQYHTAGEQQFKAYGITGVRGQAFAGFPQVRTIGLPKLERGIQNGLSLNDASCGVLLSYMAETVDTNLIHRGSVEIQKAESERIANLLKEHEFPGSEILCRLDEEYRKRNLSPGGCADLLAITLFLHFLKEDDHV